MALSSKSVVRVVPHKSHGYSLHPRLTEGEINLIVSYVNEVFLIKEGIDSLDFKAILDGTLNHPVTITKTYLFRALFEYLALLGQIDKEWMTNVCQNHMLLSPSSLWENHHVRALTRQDFYSSGRCLENTSYKSDIQLMHQWLENIRNLI